MPVQFEVSCRRARDVVPVGGALWVRQETLTSAKYMEVYLNGEVIDGVLRYALALWQYALMEVPTDTPVCPEAWTEVSCH